MIMKKINIKYKSVVIEFKIFIVICFVKEIGNIGNPEL